MRDFRKYKVWELGLEITLSMYKITLSFPQEEIYGITSQLRRAAYSIPSNIAEGCRRESDAEFKRFLMISQGSSSELGNFSILANGLGYIDDSIYSQLNDNINKVKRSLNNLIQKL
ncbi:four helix bundle protein [Flavobacteriaceae bacterium F89]|uniref:Four helix bundle protein n=1 Tax=Cerina litoralis TaxID=2874477 RepID=A0AAE3ETC4_9FLAO|nr:four helix bundle protein [Cerina litoralis]MCG2460797.1 four helix bundle protein [Cerina litoralis]